MASAVGPVAPFFELGTVDHYLDLYPVCHEHPNPDNPTALRPGRLTRRTAQGAAESLTQTILGAEDRVGDDQRPGPRQSRNTCSRAVEHSQPPERPVERAATHRDPDVDCLGLVAVASTWVDDPRPRRRPDPDNLPRDPF